MSLMIPLVTYFERHIPRQLTLHHQVPLVHQRVAEIGLDAAELDGSVQGERVGREPACEPARHVPAARAVVIRNAEERRYGACSPDHINRLVEGYAFTSIR